MDEAFLDLTGTEGLWGAPAQAGRAIKEAVRRSTGLTCSVGLAPLRFLAKIASDRDKPDGLTVVEDVEAFLATVKLKEVSGVGAVALQRLSQAGLTHLIQVRQLGMRRLTMMLGGFGARLWDLSHGVDPTGVNLGEAIKSVSHELTLERGHRRPGDSGRPSFGSEPEGLPPAQAQGDLRPGGDFKAQVFRPPPDHQAPHPGRAQRPGGRCLSGGQTPAGGRLGRPFPPHRRGGQRADGKEYGPGFLV